MLKLSTISNALTFDDVLLLPGYAPFNRGVIDLKTKLTKKITLNAPFVSSPMDTVTGSQLAMELAKLGGIGIIHRNWSVSDQVAEVKKVKEAKCLAGAAVGASPGYEERVDALVEAGIDVILVDSAHGHTKSVLDAITHIKKKHPSIEVIGGNVATNEGSQAIIDAGADAVRVGMGPGSICTTRIISGMGVPQLTAISEASIAANKAGIPVIADGGIKYSGDMVKALAAGASTVMMGSYFAACEEAPGDIKELTADQVPGRFKSILKDGKTKYKFKQYRAMGSIGAMKHGAAIKSEDEFHGKSYKDRVLVAEGVESLIPLKGSLKDVIDQTVGGLRSGLYYIGAKNIQELQEKGQFVQITQASLTESHPHDILITNPGMNY